MAKSSKKNPKKKSTQNILSTEQQLPAIVDNSVLLHDLRELIEAA